MNHRNHLKEVAKAIPKKERKLIQIKAVGPRCNAMTVNYVLHAIPSLANHYTIINFIQKVLNEIQWEVSH